MKEVKFRYAIICSLADGTEYIYKSYANKKKLQAGEERFLQRAWKPTYRTAKIKITTEEVIDDNKRIT